MPSNQMLKQLLEQYYGNKVKALNELLGNMVKVLEQYTTKLSSEEHQALQQAIKWLYENGFLKKTNKYEVTRYALKTLVDIVENKKKKSTEKSLKEEIVKEETSPQKSEKEEIVPKKESEKKEISLEKSSEKKEIVSAKETEKEEVSLEKKPAKNSVKDLSYGGQGA